MSDEGDPGNASAHKTGSRTIEDSSDSYRNAHWVKADAKRQKGKPQIHRENLHDGSDGRQHGCSRQLFSVQGPVGDLPLSSDEDALQDSFPSR